MANPVTNRFGKGFLKVVSAMNAIATFWIFLIMFLMTGDVFGRVLFSLPITGTPELVKVSLVGIIFMQMPHTFWMNRHIRSEFILMKVGPVSRGVLNCVAYLLGAAIFLGIFVSSWSATVMSWDILEFEGEGALRVPVYPIRTIILVGSSLTAILFAVRFIQNIHLISKISRQGKN